MTLIPMTFRLNVRFLDHHEEVVRDRTDFEENQLDSAAVEACLVPATTPERDAEQGDVKEADETEGEQLRGVRYH